MVSCPAGHTLAMMLSIEQIEPCLLERPTASGNNLKFIYLRDKG